MKITAIIIDDEKMARTLLAGMIEEFVPDIEVLEQCIDLPSGVKAIHKHKPDLVFLDIEMPGFSGLELLDFFDPEEVHFSIIFTTAYNQYAVQAFKLSAIDYLLKPIEPHELEQSIERYKKNNQPPDYSILKSNLDGNLPQKIALHSVNSIKFVETDEILFMKAEGSYTDITLRGGKTITVSKGLKKYEEILAGNPSFFRCHKSYLVNLKYITEYIKTDGGSLLIENEFHVSVSTEKVNELFDLLGWLN